MPEVYNEDYPPALLARGIFEGKGLDIDPESFVPYPGSKGRIMVCKVLDHATPTLMNDGEHGLMALKVMEDTRDRIPHSARKEGILLGQMNHENVIPLLNAYYVPANDDYYVPTTLIFTPLYPFTLSSLISSASFTSETTSFSGATSSLVIQMLSAVAYIHGIGIAHRDIAPSNFVIGRNGVLKLIDFGIAVEEGDEESGKMCFEIGTGPYRAPELLFGSKSYDIFALDLWALGATISELFMPFAISSPPSPRSDNSWPRDDSDEELDSSPKRQTLFNGNAGDFALIGSIFRVLGTPTLESWPEAQHLKDFSRFTFVSLPPTPLSSHLEHLAANSPLLQAVEGFLRISARKRVDAVDALELIQAEADTSPANYEAIEKFLHELEILEQ